MEAEKQKKYNPIIDLLRIIAILAVVIIHTTTRTLEFSHYDLLKVPWTFFLNQAMRFAVPLFFMISGFLLELNYPFHVNFLTYLKKRLNRIFIPYVFWSAIYYSFIYTKNPDNFLQSLLTGSASYQLYFIPSLLIFYFIFPLIHKYYYLFSKKYTLILLGCFQILFLFYDYFIQATPLYYPIRIAFLNYFVFLFGVVCSRNLDRITGFLKKWRIVLYILTAVFAVTITYQAGSLYLQTHNYLAFYSQWRPDIFVYTFLLTGSLYYILDKNVKNVRLIKTFSKLSFFVFFIHVIILEAVWNLVGKKLFLLTNGAIAQNLFYDPLYFLIVAGISFGIAAIVHKIPYVSKLSG